MLWFWPGGLLQSKFTITLRLPETKCWDHVKMYIPFKYGGFPTMHQRLIWFNLHNICPVQIYYINSVLPFPSSSICYTIIHSYIFLCIPIYLYHIQCIYIWNVLVAFNEIYKPETSVNTIWNRWFPERKCPSDLHLIPRWRSRNSGDGWCGDRSSGICGRWTLARGDRSPWVGRGVDLRDISHGRSIYGDWYIYLHVGKYISPRDFVGLGFKIFGVCLGCREVHDQTSIWLVGESVNYLDHPKDHSLFGLGLSG